MLPAGVGADQRACQLNVPVREADVFTLLDLYPACEARSGTVAPPGQGGDLASAIALKLNSGLDRGRGSGARTGEELVAICRIQRPNVAGLIKRDELIRAGELAPELEIQESVGSPLISAGVLAERLLAYRAHGGSLTRQRHGSYCEENHGDRRSDQCPSIAHMRPLRMLWNVRRQ